MKSHFSYIKYVPPRDSIHAFRRSVTPHAFSDYKLLFSKLALGAVSRVGD